LNDDKRSLVADLAKSAEEHLPATPDQDGQLRALINRLIEQPDLYQPQLFADSIEKEGRRLGQQLAQTGKLTSEQHRRLNRLLLEATFPKTLGNIYVHGWRPSMLVYGVIGVVVAALFWRGVRDDPARDPRCNQAERALILKGTEASPSALPVKEQFPWRAMLTDVSLWGNCLLQFTTNIGWLFLVRSMPSYLSEVHGVPLITRGWMTSVPIWVGVCGVFFGGRLADALVQRLGLKWGRRLPVLITRFTAALGYAICIALSWLVPKEMAPHWFPWVYVAALSLVALSTDIGVPAIWAFAQDVGGKYTASILGWGNMWGNLGATVATPLYAYVLGAHTLTDWNLLFCCLGGAYLIGAVGVLFMDPTRSLTIVRDQTLRE
jgi:MFS transporter, ACS family, glucarate transporter